MTDYQELMARQARMAGWRDMDAEFWPHFEAVRSETMLSVERLYDLYKSVQYIARADIPGTIVECGVWRGGAMMLAARVLASLDCRRAIHLYDTFSGHPKPGRDHNTSIFGGVGADEWRPDWNVASLSGVILNMESTGYPKSLLHYHEGDAARTVENSVPSRIAIARLDVDWYETTAAIVPRLWERLSPGGIMIFDDYGHYDGQKKAVDEFFADKPVKLTRIDYSCRTIQKA